MAIIKMHGAPDANTLGEVGDKYIDLNTNMVYECIGVTADSVTHDDFITIYTRGTQNTVYEWKAMGGGVTSWNDLTDRPFYVEGDWVELNTIEYNLSGFNGSNKFLFTGVKLFENVPFVEGKTYKLRIVDTLIGSVVETIGVASKTDLMGMATYRIGSADDLINASSMGSLTNWSLGCTHNSVSTCFYISLYEFDEVVTPLDPKFIPVDYINSLIDARLAAQASE